MIRLLTYNLICLIGPAGHGTPSPNFEITDGRDRLCRGGGPGGAGGEPRENPGHKRCGQYRHAHRLAYV